jgi:tRNA-splicing ligase RtcB
MRVPVTIYADETLVREMEEQVFQQAANVAGLPGIVKASYAMPDAHWGYGFPIGGVAGFDPDEGGVISAGGVGFDISCGVRAVRTGLTADNIEDNKPELGKVKVSASDIDDMLVGGAEWAVEQGYGTRADLAYIEENGKMAGAEPRYVSDHAKQRQESEVGTLGSGNHYLEVQRVTAVYREDIAKVLGVALNDIILMIHCGSRGLGHQIATDYLARMIKTAKEAGIELPEKELACAPIHSDVGRQYYGAMCAGINCALANRQVLMHLAREAFAQIYPRSNLTLLYDVSHNTCKVEEHVIDGHKKKLYVHRKGATRAFGPGDPSLPKDLHPVGQPVLIGGTMGTASYILTGTEEAMSLSFGSCCHGAGRSMSRSQATKRWKGKDIIMHLAQKGILIRGASARGIAEEAPGAYKDVAAVVDATETAGLAKKVARLEPLVCVKG